MRSGANRQDISLKPGLGPWTLSTGAGVSFLRYTGWGKVRCVFSTRMGGVSEPPYFSLNLSRDVKDDPGAVDENLARLRRALGLTHQKIVRARQLHSTRINVVSSPAEGLTGDGLIARLGDTWIAVSVADCVPIYFYDTLNAVISIAHAGWRGTLAGIPDACIKTMELEFGSDPANIVALMGPGIGPCCFGVSEEIAARFGRLYPGSSSHNHVDLFEANRLALERLGVKCETYDPICTSCNEEFFFSHRRDRGSTGRMLALVGA